MELLIAFILIVIAVVFYLRKSGNQNSSFSSFSRNFEAISDKYSTMEEVQQALVDAGLESSNLIMAIDYTKSNEFTGAKTFDHRCLHHISKESQQFEKKVLYPDITPSAPVDYGESEEERREVYQFVKEELAQNLNPYQQVIKIVGETLSTFDEDNLIPCFGFGDIRTKGSGVFPFYPDGKYCHGFEEVISRYNEITPRIQLSGPTNFAPAIYEAIKIVQQNRNEYHILVIIADGQVSNEHATIEAIVEASKYPLSIVVVGVGDGPFEMMQEFDDGLPQRQFDNFQFVDFSYIQQNCFIHKKDVGIAFAVACLMEIPDQYTAIKQLNLL